MSKPDSKRTRRSVQRQRLARRTFLRGAAGGSVLLVGLPVLDCMLDSNGEKTAFGQDLPMRFGTYVWGCGILHSAWVPSQTGMNWTAPHSLVPFETNGVKEYTTVLTGFNHRDSAPGHIPSRGLSLSSSHDPTYVAASEAPGYRQHNHPEPSIDTIVRNAWAGQTSRDSIDIAVTKASPYYGVSAWGGGGDYRSPIGDPKSLFNTLFGGFTPPDGEPTGETVDPREILRARLEKSVVDLVRHDAKRLQSRVGVRDQQRIEQHLSALNELERLVAQAPDGASGGMASQSCALPGEPGAGGSIREKGKLTAEVLAMALACDISRVFTFEITANQSEFVFSELGISASLHEGISHRLGGQEDAMRKVMELQMDVFAHLGAKLKAFSEGAGNVLDRTLIFGTSELANGNAHNYADHPLIFVGKAGGNIQAGQHYRREGSNHDAPHVLYSAVRAVGVNVPSIGMAPQKDSRGVDLPDRRGNQLISGVFS